MVTDHTKGQTKKSKLHLVDLGGSESVGKTNATGIRLEEAKSLNQSLSALGRVIFAHSDPKILHIPFRESKLTRLLNESLGGNAKTAMIVTVSPHKINEYETLSSLRYGSKAK